MEDERAEELFEKTPMTGESGLAASDSAWLRSEGIERGYAKLVEGTETLLGAETADGVP